MFCCFKGIGAVWCVQVPLKAERKPMTGRAAGGWVGVCVACVHRGAGGVMSLLMTRLAELS